MGPKSLGIKQCRKSKYWTQMKYNTKMKVKTQTQVKNILNCVFLLTKIEQAEGKFSKSKIRSSGNSYLAESIR